ncbi:MAG: hypothetical protein KAX62_05820 [Xylophilus sp.]|jgi:hypothetical protein|nr:hypothetical protein [Xylophilus sp.]
MSISPKTLLLLQKAGENLYAARNALAQDVQQHASRVVHMVASEPFGNDADRAYAQLRSIARMAHELQAMEEQLKTLYGSAMELAAAEPPVLVDLSDRSPRARVQPSALGVEEAQDVQIKPVQPKQPLRKKATASVTAEPARPRQRLSANDQKVLAYLKQVLDRRSWKPLTQVAIADGAGIPKGSVGLALRRVIDAGMVREGQKGNYRLG